MRSPSAHILLAIASLIANAQCLAVPAGTTEGLDAILRSPRRSTSSQLDGPDAHFQHAKALLRRIDSATPSASGSSDEAVSGSASNDEANSDYDDARDSSDVSSTPPSLRNADGSTKNYWSLYRWQQDDLLTRCANKGKAMESLMMTFVNSHTSRLAQTDSNQDQIFIDNYSIDVEWTEDPIDYAKESQDDMYNILNDAGIELDPTQGWGQIGFRSNVRPDDVGNVPIVVGYNKNAGVLLSIWSYKEYDYNDPNKKAFSSTLTWNAWRKAVGQQYASDMKTQIRFGIKNIETNNVMALVHRKFKDNVDAIPDFKDTPEGDPPKSMGPVAGHGKWTPDSEAWHILLGTVNMQSTMNMIMDYNTDMKYPYMVAIHTFPPVNEESFPMPAVEDIRMGYMIIEYDSQPYVASAR